MTLGLDRLTDALRQVPAYGKVVRTLGSRRKLEPLGVIEAARPIVAATLLEDLARAGLLIAATDERAEQMAAELAVWSDLQVIQFPAPEPLPFERIPWGAETISRRMRAMVSLLWRHKRERPVVVASVRAILTPLPSPQAMKARLRQLRVGDRVSLSRLSSALAQDGYKHEPVVDSPGTFARRGGIVDVFLPIYQMPVRVEFFGDEVDSLRWFDPASQRSQGTCREIVLCPACEAVVGTDGEATAALRGVDLSRCHTAARADLESDIRTLEEGALPAEFGVYLGYLYDGRFSLLDYLQPEDILLMDDLVLADEVAAEFWKQADEARRRGEIGGDIPEGLAPPVLAWEALRSRLMERRVVALGSDFGERLGPMREVFSPQEHMGGQVRLAVEKVSRAAERGVAILITRQAQRFAEIWGDRDRRVAVSKRLSGLSAGVHLLEGWHPQGWVMHVPGLGDVSLFTDVEVFGWHRPARRRKPKRRPVDSVITELEPGDYVVHIEHGIGVYRGLCRLNTGGVEREYLEIEYAEGDRLYVPPYQVDRVSRYVGAGQARPALNRLGGASWEMAKARARKAVEDMADELLDLYAARKVVPGYAFGPDDTWQRELEASFPYLETEDQLRTINQIKMDMEKPQPMDRLVCGDVGYGKTEVALRAAFKAVMNGKQVAVLVPTTILAQQHFDTFRQRLRLFPVVVEMLSRFRTRAEQKAVAERLRRGEIDIVIGTHRLLQSDIEFKELGLVIIDEEQRFGVREKEKLKQMRKEVDVLTMTATPIPRTLNMALTGLRDLSVIDTAPEDRLPVWTYVSSWDDDMVARALQREMARAGQAFVVNDRVRGIELLAARIQRLVPGAEVAVAHGQLPERELSAVMHRFAAGEADVLVCTSIIESGLDIPNANTIIVNHADRFGLAQLYQLRGRVGRGSARAYAYLLFSPGQGLSSVARQRLKAIMEAADLGAGFQVAMRDLEIRGAGDILGRRQHGHISAVGFDLYTRLLAQAVAERREALGDHASEASDVAMLVRPLKPGLQINLPLRAELPESALPDASLRLALYRRLATLGSVEEVDAFEEELRDRLGELAPEVENLLYQMRVKIVAEALGATAIGVEARQFYVRMDVSWLRKRDLREWLKGVARLGVQQVWIDMTSEDDWQTTLLWVLRTLLRMKCETLGADGGGAPTASVSTNHRPELVVSE